MVINTYNFDAGFRIGWSLSFKIVGIQFQIVGSWVQDGLSPKLNFSFLLYCIPLEDVFIRFRQDKSCRKVEITLPFCGLCLVILIAGL